MESFFLYSESNPLIFTNAQFWLFFGVVMLIFQLTYKQITMRNMFLFALSIFFYYKSSGVFVVLLLLTTCWDYQMGKLIYNEKREKWRKWYVALCVIANLIVLGYFKYTYFLADIVNQLAGTTWHPSNIVAVVANTWFGQQFDISKIILPVGISFYTFQSISYCVDIYRKEIYPVENILDYAFFVSFFPQLVAGPIVRASDFIPQVYRRYELNQTEFGHSLWIIMVGLTKKILVSDYISINFVDRVFDSPLTYSGLENLLAVYGYTIQIYCDFSGYTDIAIGVALLMGFRLNRNFDSPYQATNITDFWRRWHISLSTWLRDYLYIPLGGNRHGKWRAYFNQFITMLIGGLWHGAHLRFIIWGALHGMALAVHKFYLTFQNKNTKTSSAWWANVLGGFITLHFVAFCWIFFRAANMETVWQVLGQITSHFKPELLGQVMASYKAVIVLIISTFLVHWIPRKYKDIFANYFVRVPMPLKAVVIVVVVVALYQVKTAELQPFIYFQF